MRIGFDVSQTGSAKAGCGYFADSLIRHLAEIDTENEYILYPTFGGVYWDPHWPDATCQIDRPNFRRGVGHASLDEAQQFWDNPPPDLETRLGNPDIIHANNFFCPTGLQNTRLVYTLHDLAFIEHPEWSTEPNRVGCFTGVFNASLYADVIIAVSDYSRQHFLQVFPHYPADRIVVIHEASRFSYRPDLTKPLSLSRLAPEQFWLTVGTLEPRKNHLRLLRAYAQLKTLLGKTFPLVLAGGTGWLMDEFEKTLDDLGLRQDVILLGYVGDTELQWLYQNCFAFVYPSLFEGFGLPVVEAMSLGAAVIASDATSIPEIVGDAGILCNPSGDEAVAQAMLQVSLQEQLRQRVREMALHRAAKFSWHAAARAVLGSYDTVRS